MYNNFVSITEANQNFSSVAKKCSTMGELVIMKNNKPVFLLKNLSNDMELTNDELIEIASKRVLKKYHKAFEELAK